MCKKSHPLDLSRIYLTRVLNREIHNPAALNKLSQGLVFHLTLQPAHIWPINIIHVDWYKLSHGATSIFSTKYCCASQSYTKYDTDIIKV